MSEETSFPDFSETTSEKLMDAKNDYDLIVIGGGPAGYAGAIRAGQLGKKVACIESERAGGTCLNWGCIPSKALLRAAELYEDFKNAGEFGFTVPEIAVDFAKVMARSRRIADRMGRGIEYLFKKNKVDYFLGKGRVSAPGTVEITAGAEKGGIFFSERILLSTGCKARALPGLEVTGERVLTSREALALKRKPASIIILGAGAIGVEFAYFLNAMGCAVTLVEMLPAVLPLEDGEISRTLARALKKQGIRIHLGVKAENISAEGKSVSMDLAKGDERVRLEAESLLLAIGVRANTKGLCASEMKPEEEKGFLKVNDHYETSVRGLFAAGDLIGPPWLAHVATFEAIQAVNGMFGVNAPQRARVFPACTYCRPQVASVGLTEEAARERGFRYKVGKFPFSASGKAVASNRPAGFVKLIVAEKNGEILGAHIIGHDATELIAECVLAMKAELTVDEIHHAIHPHPTMSEALAEAAASVRNEAIHI